MADHLENSDSGFLTIFFIANDLKGIIGFLAFFSPSRYSDLHFEIRTKFIHHFSFIANDL